jgi:hypothetical protein
MAALLLLAFLAVLSVLVLTGHTTDSRDPDYTLGQVFTPGSAPPAQN